MRLIFGAIVADPSIAAFQIFCRPASPERSGLMYQAQEDHLHDLAYEGGTVNPQNAMAPGRLFRRVLSRAIGRRW
jgi:hypothetical protein